MALVNPQTVAEGLGAAAASQIDIPTHVSYTRRQYSVEAVPYLGDAHMHKKTLKRVVEILESDPDIYVPLKKLWVMLQDEGLVVDAELEDFIEELRADTKFEFAPGLNIGPESAPSSELLEEREREMEALGFFSGPRVKLVAREMTADDIFTGLRNSLTRMNEALQNAWQTRPEGDQETEDQLLEILGAGQKLEREIQELLDQSSVKKD